MNQHNAGQATEGERLLRRSEAAAHIRAYGIPCATSTLAKYASVGGGPLMEKFGPWPMYRPSQLDAWVASKLSKPVTSTNQLRGAA